MILIRIFTKAFLDRLVKHMHHAILLLSSVFACGQSHLAKQPLLADSAVIKIDETVLSNFLERFHALEEANKYCDFSSLEVGKIAVVADRFPRSLWSFTDDISNKVYQLNLGYENFDSFAHLADPEKAKLKWNHIRDSLSREGDNRLQFRYQFELDTALSAVEGASYTLHVSYYGDGFFQFGIRPNTVGLCRLFYPICLVKVEQKNAHVELLYMTLMLVRN